MSSGKAEAGPPLGAWSMVLLEYERVSKLSLSCLELRWGLLRRAKTTTPLHLHRMRAVTLSLLTHASFLPDSTAGHDCAIMGSGKRGDPGGEDVELCVL